MIIRIPFHISEQTIISRARFQSCFAFKTSFHANYQIHRSHQSDASSSKSDFEQTSSTEFASSSLSEFKLSSIPESKKLSFSSLEQFEDKPSK